MRRLGVPALIPALLTIPALALALPASTAAQPEAARRAEPVPRRWSETVVDADQNFRGLEAVSKREAWVTGESLTDDGPARVFRTTDRGQTWTDVSPDGTEGLSFRDVEVHGSVAHVLAIGPGEASRIYRSTDGGASWDRVVPQHRREGVLRLHGVLRQGQARTGGERPGRRQAAHPRHRRPWPLVVGAARQGHASLEGRVRLRRQRRLPRHLRQVGVPDHRRQEVARLRSDDRGRTWTAVASGIPAGEAAGGFAGAFASPRVGIAVGGDFAEADDTEDTTAYTRDGRTWTTRRRPLPRRRGRRLPARHEVRRRDRRLRRVDRVEHHHRRRAHVEAREPEGLPRHRLRRHGLLGRRQQGPRRPQLSAGRRLAVCLT